MRLQDKQFPYTRIKWVCPRTELGISVGHSLTYGNVFTLIADTHPTRKAYAKDFEFSAPSLNGCAWVDSYYRGAREFGEFERRSLESYFGTGAREVIKGFKNYEDVVEWLSSDPVSVLRIMGINLEDYPEGWVDGKPVPIPVPMPEATAEAPATPSPKTEKKRLSLNDMIRADAMIRAGTATPQVMYNTPPPRPLGWGADLTADEVPPFTAEDPAPITDEPTIENLPTAT